MIKPQDIAVVLQLTQFPGQPFRELATAVGLSPGEAHNAVQRLIEARLVRAPDRSVRLDALHEFLRGGVPYLYREPGDLYAGAARVVERNPTLAVLLALVERLRRGGPSERASALTAVRETTREPYRATSEEAAAKRQRVVRVVSRKSSSDDDLSSNTTPAERLAMVDLLSRRLSDIRGIEYATAVYPRPVAMRSRRPLESGHA